MTRDDRSSLGFARLHRECWERIPWLVNETLDAGEYRRIEPHLRTCEQCQAELEAQRRLRNAMRGDEQVVLAPQAALQKLMVRIEAAEADPPPAPEHELDEPRRVRRTLRWAAAAAGAAGLALALTLTTHDGVESLSTTPRFETLTTPARIAADGPVIRAVFVSGVALHEMNAILHAVDAQIIAGPSEAGVYTLTLRSGEAPERRSGAEREQAVEAALARLRADSRVLFAEAALARSTVSDP